MGWAREACTTQAQQRLTVNNMVSTTPMTGHGGRIMGSEVVLKFARAQQHNQYLPNRSV